MTKLSLVWRLNPIPKIKFFDWKLIRVRIPARESLRTMGLETNRDCTLCTNHLEDLDHLYIMSFC